MTLFPDIISDYDVRFAAWMRIEPRCRANETGGGVEARTGDALWFLARQWQVGEFMGDDAASPVSVRLEHSAQSVQSLRLGNATKSQSVGGDGAGVPLEMLVERERSRLDWRTRVQIGQKLERLAEEHLGTEAPALIEALREVYPVAVPAGDEFERIDRATQRLIRFVSGRVVDGGALLLAVQQDSLAPVLTAYGVSTALQEALIAGLLDWYGKLCSQPGTIRPKAWDPHKLDYHFRVSAAASSGADAAEQTQLVASDYRNGDLDWYAFAHDGPVRGAWDRQPAIETLPTRIEISGTNNRWWAFEEATTDFGDLDVSKTDLAKLLLMEFALVDGDDWFSVPVPVKIGSLSKIDRLTVTNVFGETVIVPPARKLSDDPLQRWEMYSLTLDRDTGSTTPQDILYVPQVAGFREESKPVEEVRFMRDEGANMVWAVETTVLNGMGDPVDGGEAQRERVERRYETEIRGFAEKIEILDQQLAGTLSDEDRATLRAERDAKQARIERLARGPTARLPIAQDTIPRYRLASTVPENWFPFVPVQCGPPDEPCMRLRIAQMLRNVDDEEPTDIPAMSQLLEHDPLLWVDEETVLRAGLRVLHTKQRIRWVDGKTYLWLGRKVLTGRGEGASRLRFDGLDFDATE